VNLRKDHSKFRILLVVVLFCAIFGLYEMR
jgi:hypothetical protein